MSDRIERQLADMEARELKRRKDEDRRQRALAMIRDGVSGVEICRALGMGKSTVRKLVAEVNRDA